jgi:hypothetical protein
MRNAAWCYRNHLLNATITAGAAEQALGVDQLQNDQGGASMGWQTPAGVMASWFQITVPAARAFRAFGLFRTNLTAEAQVRWRAGSLDTGMASAGLQPGYGQSVLVLPTDVVTQTVRCDISDPNNPDGFLNIALAYAGEAQILKHNYSYSSSFGRQEGADEVRSRAGGVYATLRWAARQWDVALNSLSRDEAWSIIMELDAVARLRRNVLFVPNPDSNNINREAVFGIARSSAGIGIPSHQMRSWRATIEERL